MAAEFEQHHMNACCM